MLPSLYIQGFRCFRELTVERLGRVNLIVGKNNVGKTTLLDALRIHAAQDDALYELEELLDRRGEIARTRKSADSPRRVVDWPRAFHDASIKDGNAVLGIRTCDAVDETLQLTVRVPSMNTFGTIGGWSVHDKLWRYVFEVASALDVQVFSTTHSWGCIDAFQVAARDHEEEGLLIRLERRDGETRAFLFDEEDLAVVAKQAIEVR